MSELSRRNFLKGAFGASVAAGIGLAAAGCSSTSTAASSESAAASEPAAVPSLPDESIQYLDHSYGSYLNPQEDFTQDSGDYSAIFSPLKIGGVTLKNRLVKSSAGSEMQKDAIWPSDTALEYYGAFAKGGIGMICFESSSCIPAGDMSAFAGADAIGGIPAGSSGMDMFQLDISTDDGIPAHKAIADYLHQYDVPVLAQMMDMMMFTGGGGSFAETEKLETSMNPGIMQTTENVRKERDNFIKAGVRYWKAGFDGVEINCSCNHYFSTFLSRYSNHERTDEYSGDTIENRCRIVTEIIEGIRREVGDDFIIQVLYSGVEENVGTLGDNSLCITVDEACEMAKLFEKAGASSLHIRSQAYGHHCAGFMPDVFHMYEHGHTGYGSTIDYGKHFCGLVDGRHEGYGGLIEVAAKIKSCVSIPVGTVGSMDPRIAPDLFNNAIKDGKIDFMLMTRPLMADMALPNKLQEGKRDEIAPCTRCMTCFVAPFGIGLPMYCRVNPALTRAFTEDMPEGYDPAPAASPKRVMVVGGGPAGMEAARIAAQRGHTVTLYEKGAALGGRLAPLQTLKGTHERIDDYREYLVRQMEVRGVTVRLGTEVTVDLVKSEAPDCIVVAVGGAVTPLEVSGSVLTMDEVMDQLTGTGRIDAGDRVVLIGAQFQACEIAANLARQGKTVTVINPEAESNLYLNGTVWSKLMGKDWLFSKGVKFYHEAKVRTIESGIVSLDTCYGTTVAVEADTVINALPLSSERTLFDAVTGLCAEAYAVGDCYAPNTIANATARANIIARKLGSGSGSSDAALKENQYSATATGIGDVKVTITVEDGKIVDAIVDTSNETAGIGRELGADFADQIVAKGGVDSVSGATVTTSAVQQALAKCKELAGIR